MKMIITGFIYILIGFGINIAFAAETVYRCAQDDSPILYRDYPCPLNYTQLEINPDLIIEDKKRKEAREREEQERIAAENKIPPLESRFVTTVTENQIICPIIQTAMTDCKIDSEKILAFNQECLVRGLNVINGFAADATELQESCLYSRIQVLTKPE